VSYQNKLSGPIIDRIDLWIEVSKIDYAGLTRRKHSGSETIEGRKTIILARKAQERRYEKEGKLNSDAVIRDSIDAMKLSGAANDILKKAGEADGMSGRGYHRIIRLSRTIADIEGTEQIETRHVLEALQYRKKG
jgi:magnesium chelatase family protein